MSPPDVSPPHAASPPRTARSPAPPGGPPHPVLVAGLKHAAPLWLAGWVIMRLGGRHGPGLGWNAAHSLWVVAAVLFGAALVGLHRLATEGRPRRVAASVVLGTALAGAATLFTQVTIDGVLSLLSADHDALSRRYDDLFAVPGVRLVLFQAGPPLLFAGLLVLAFLAARAGRLPAPAAWLVGVGVVATAAGRPAPGWWRAIEGLGVVCLWLGLDRASRA